MQVLRSRLLWLSAKSRSQMRSPSKMRCAAQKRGQLLVDQPDDLGAVLAVVAVVDLADEARRRCACA